MAMHLNKKGSQAEALLEIWDVLLRYRWRFIVPTFLVMVAVLAGSLLLPRKYNAEANYRILIAIYQQTLRDHITATGSAHHRPSHPSTRPQC